MKTIFYMSLVFFADGAASSMLTSKTPYLPSTEVKIDGAAGNGVDNDRAVVQRVINDADDKCIDGEGKTYGILGRLDVTRNFCIRNAKFVQLAVPFDTAPYIKIDPKNRYPLNLSATDTFVPSGAIDVSTAVSGIQNSRNIRTFLIRPGVDGAPFKVTMENIHITRGKHDTLGAPSDSAGIWLEGVSDVYLNNIEVTGKGHGAGIFIYNAKNVHLNNIYIHDMTWAPYAGDHPIMRGAINGNWNVVPIFDFHRETNKFVQVRIQERLVGITVQEVDNFLLENSRIEKIEATTNLGPLPWQTDGMTIGRGTRNVTIRRSNFSRVWEAIDLVGIKGKSGEVAANHVYEDLTMSDLFNYGVKIGYDSVDVTARRIKMNNIGLNGVVVTGPSKLVHIEDVEIEEMGVVRIGTENLEPWSNVYRSGIMAWMRANQVSVLNTTVKNIIHRGKFEYGFFLRPEDASDTSLMSVKNSSSTGHRLFEKVGTTLYSAPFSTASGAPLADKIKYNWYTSAWSGCMNDSDTRIVLCKNSYDLEVLTSNCIPPMPSTTRACGAALNCSLGGTTILNGASIRAYQQGNLPFGYNCENYAENRTCNSGVLSGSYANTSCDVAPPPHGSCKFQGKLVEHGKSIRAYQQGSLPFGYNCENYAENRTCNNGVLSGSYVNTSCDVAPPPHGSCKFQGKLVEHGKSIRAYQQGSLPFGYNCENYAENRSCNNGVLSGSFQNLSCVTTPLAP